MTFSNLFKQLKRRLRMKKRWLSLGAYFLLAGGIAGAMWMDGGKASHTPETQAVWSMAADPQDQARQDTESVLETIRKEDIKREMVLHTQYVCGEEIHVLGAMEPKEIMSLRGEHPNAKISLDDAGKVHLTENVEDLGPRCKENAYFGMDKNGNLTLFDGIPEQERVIRTFFQLDVEHMKSSLPTDAMKQLHTGIRINDLADYNSVLSTFVEYAMDRAEPVSNAKEP